ncbi:hypothetical protein [Rhizobium sp. BE258]|uniref:hypothetical protein n=1 Tax=Rhizobium sp. BE258 TaxID=2817722 RepID=UPI0028560518|nr:hypothetical protein [Rhizobium sp. BE258]MDR7146177.1 hypothetical protein [Rhizobium sp. BE258]
MSSEDSTGKDAGELEEAKLSYEEFVADISKKLAVAEKRLDLPAGTLAEFYREPDYIFVIKIIAAAEPIVNELIEAGMSRSSGGLGGRSNKEMFAPIAAFATDKLPLSGRASKIELAQRLEMINDDDIDFLETIAVIRNRYAHNIRNASRPLVDLLKEASSHNAKISRKLLYGMDVTFSELPNGFCKVLIGWGFSVFLEHAEERLHVPSGGLFGLLAPLQSDETVDYSAWKKEPKR